MLTDADLKVLDGIEMQGRINTDDAQLVANIQHSIRLGHPQIKPQPMQKDRVCLVGGGPSLESTLPELRDLYFAGAKVVTVNGAYQWCLDRNIRPSAQIVLDARPENARFVSPGVPQCLYLLASQCAPETWKAVDGRSDVWIWHAVAPDNPTAKPILDQYYMGQWTASPGGTTVVVRSIILLRLMGYLRFDLFGVDSCVMGNRHHAYAQPENDADRAYPFEMRPPGRPDMARTFLCSPWHAKQIECMLQTVKLHGENFLINVHGDGAVAYALRCMASVGDVAIGFAEP